MRAFNIFYIGACGDQNNQDMSKVFIGNNWDIRQKGEGQQVPLPIPEGIKCEGAHSLLPIPNKCKLVVKIPHACIDTLFRFPSK